MPQSRNNGIVASGSQSLRTGENDGPPQANPHDSAKASLRAR